MNYKVEVKIVEANGNVQPLNASFDVSGNTVEDAKKAAISLLKARRMPPIRSVSFTKDNRIVVYAGVKEQKVDKEGDYVSAWDPPKGAKKMRNEPIPVNKPVQLGPGGRPAVVSKVLEAKKEEAKKEETKKEEAKRGKK